MEKHANAMLEELRANGHDTLGIAGGILLARDEESDDTNVCHTFFILDEKVEVNGGPVNAEDFVKDVAGTMVRGHSKAGPKH